MIYSLSVGNVVVNLCLGFKQATIIIIGNLIGENDVRRAKTMAWIILLQFSLITFPLALAIHIYRKEVLSIFADGGSTKRAEKLMYMLSINTIFLMLRQYFMGCVTALGKQALGVVPNMIVSIGILWTSSVYLSVELKLGVVGLWFAICIMELF